MGKFIQDHRDTFQTAKAVVNASNLSTMRHANAGVTKQSPSTVKAQGQQRLGLPHEAVSSVDGRRDSIKGLETHGGPLMDITNRYSCFIMRSSEKKRDNSSKRKASKSGQRIKDEFEANSMNRA